MSAGRRPRLIHVAAVALAVAAAGCVPWVTPAPSVLHRGAPPPVVQISASPDLIPAFSASVSDYVIRCSPGVPMAVAVVAPQGTTVSVDGQPAARGSFVANVTRGIGQSFTIVARSASKLSSSTYYVRCLPTDFPTWSAQKTGPTQAEWYAVSSFKGKYPAIFDSNGVPVWWGVPPVQGTLFGQVLADGNFAWVTADGMAQEVGFDGAVVRPVTPPPIAADWHDLLLLPNGDHVIAVNTILSNIDLAAAWGAATPPFPSSAQVLDQVIEELDPSGTVVWWWDAMDHIPVTETDPGFRRAQVNGAYDAYHWNSVEFTGTGFILSFRHLNAVYNVDQATGDIVWKLGGSARAESLAIQNDSVFTNGGGFGGQHDARVLSDGTVTLYDDGTKQSRAPRAVRYQIDTNAHTATLLEQHDDPLLSTESPCCGSARELVGGDWVVGWGGTNIATEMSPDGTRQFSLQFAAGTTLYRTIPVPFGQLSRATLRAGMDAQYASSGAAHSTTQPRSRSAPLNVP